MASVDGPKYMGPLIIDLTEVKDDLVDLPPGAMKGIRKEQPGMDAVVAELASAMPSHGEAAEVPPQAYQRFVARTATITKLRAKMQVLAKAMEVCLESCSKEENNREDDLTILVKAVQDTARRTKSPGVEAPFEKAIKYNGQIAEKGVKTRRANAAEAQANAASAEAAQGGAQAAGGKPPGQGGSGKSDDPAPPA